LLRLGRTNPESIQGSLPRTGKRHEETNAGEIPSTSAATAGGLSNFSSGSVGSGFRATAWPDGTSSREMAVSNQSQHPAQL